jgi:hypothetical protein
MISPSLGTGLFHQCRAEPLSAGQLEFGYAPTRRARPPSILLYRTLCCARALRRFCTTRVFGRPCLKTQHEGAEACNEVVERRESSEADASRMAANPLSARERRRQTNKYLTWTIEQDDCAAVSDFRSDCQGSHQGNPAQNALAQPHAGCNFGDRKWLRRFAL